MVAGPGSPRPRTPQTRALLSLPPGVPRRPVDTVRHLLVSPTEVATVTLRDSKAAGFRPPMLLLPPANQLVCWVVTRAQQPRGGVLRPPGTRSPSVHAQARLLPAGTFCEWLGSDQETEAGIGTAISGGGQGGQMSPGPQAAV